MIIFSSQLLCHENIIWQYIDRLSFQTFNWLSSLPQSLSSHLTFYALLLCYFTFQSSYELISFDDLAMLSFQLKRACQWLEIWFWSLVKEKLRSESWFLNDLVIKVFFFLTFQDRRHRRTQAGSMEVESQKEYSDTDRSDNPDSRSGSRGYQRT